jgi:hypothetical protein
MTSRESRPDWRNGTAFRIRFSDQLNRPTDTARQPEDQECRHDAAVDEMTFDALADFADDAASYAELAAWAARHRDRRYVSLHVRQLCAVVKTILLTCADLQPGSSRNGRDP